MYEYFSENNYKLNQIDIDFSVVIDINLPQNYIILSYNDGKIVAYDFNLNFVKKIYINTKIENFKIFSVVSSINSDNLIVSDDNSKIVMLNINFEDCITIKDDETINDIYLKCYFVKGPIVLW